MAINFKAILLLVLVGVIQAVSHNAIDKWIDRAVNGKNVELVQTILQTLKSHIEGNRNPIGMALPFKITAAPSSYAVVKYFTLGSPSNACPSPSDQAVSIGLNVCLPTLNTQTNTTQYLFYSSNSTSLFGTSYNSSTCTGPANYKSVLPIGSCYANIVKAMKPAATINYGSQTGLIINAYTTASACNNQKPANLIGGFFLPTNSNNCAIFLTNQNDGTSQAFSCTGSNVTFQFWNTSSSCSGTPEDQGSVPGNFACTSPQNCGYIYGYPYYSCNGPFPSTKPTRKPTSKSSTMTKKMI